MTYRRAAYLVLGGVLFLPYAMVTWGLVRVARDSETPAAVWVTLSVVTAVIGCAPPLLRGTRAVQVAAGRALLGVRLPDPPEHIDAEARLRSALWFTLHLAVGALVGLLLFVALPGAVVLILTSGGWGAAGLILLGVAVLPGTAYALAGLGALAALMAPALLGPATRERTAALEAETVRLAEHNRLARELHDSIGHALTVSVLQAGAAGQLFDRDPAFARRALSAIEETGRAAMEDLDRVLGLLRDGEGRTLAQVGRLSAGLPVEVTAHGPVRDVPAAVSREAYGLIQEAVTNALRHDPQGPVSVEVMVTGRSLTVEVVNTLRATGEGGGGGRGLAGMRERVALHGGVLQAGPRHGRWRVRAELPW
ncbi:histidine kinase [Winogradskya consettensis]|uniref:histidine kinase n=1 Tax=Winogradskya consettensis TaxID=113560 RepID=A0A919SMU6_9ACTN|nr:histidine kinase [Actinoplanes consettensis]GIM74639.1 two-component sensor histidine kinase [Actinoplanes consettensis]